MEFALSEEQQQLQEMVRDFLAATSPEAAVRAQGDPVGYDADLWLRMAKDLGLPAIAIPEQHGGAGFGFVELGVVLEELGRALAVSPFLACVMASELLLGMDDPAAGARFLPAIASGELIATVAIAGDQGSWRPADAPVHAVADGGAWRVTGTTSYVLDGASAHVALVVARDDSGTLGVFSVDSPATAPGVTCEPLASMDFTRKIARLTFESVAAQRIGATDATPAVERMLDRIAIALAADSVGGLARVLDMAVQYATVREQFGRPIGSFQAIKHKCASMLVDLEAARSAVLYSTWAASVDHEDTPRVAPLAKAFCTDAYVAGAGENIQIHGGIGFTWDYPAHLYLKRAKNNQTFLGGSDLHRQLLADRIGI
jgi:alkylation response protein AidB-like acyl-CoA dehydrogenase